MADLQGNERETAPEPGAAEVESARRRLVERVAASRYIFKSARLRELLDYLTGQVLEGPAREIHEQEVGHHVFGRAPDYDTATDNIVRVNASLLRKRLEQYFSTDGSLAAKPAVRMLWSQVFRGGEPSNLVLDDAAVGLFQEITGEPLTLSQYFDRSYLRQLDEAAARAHLDPATATAIVLRRHTSYAASGISWRLCQIAASLNRQVSVQFARDFSFRGLKSGNTVLLGHSRTNPWVEPFEPRLGLRWEYRPDQGISIPVDTWANPPDPNRYSVVAEPAERQGYAMIAHLPNLAGNGSVLIVAGTGGSAVGSAGDFLTDEPSVARLLTTLPKAAAGGFPYFEVLLQTRGRSSLPKDVKIVLSRSPRL